MLIHWANTLLLETLHTLNDRVVQLAVQAKVTKGRKLRLDATCVQTNIHHPTDIGLLVDSVRVLSRFVQRVKELVRNVQQKCRSRLRSARQAAQTLHRQLRRKGEEKEAVQKKLYEKLIQTAEQMVRQSRQVVAALSQRGEQQAKLLLCLWKREQGYVDGSSTHRRALTASNFWGTHSEGGSEYLSVRIALRRAKLTGCSGDKAGCFSVMDVSILTVVLFLGPVWWRSLV